MKKTICLGVLVMSLCCSSFAQLGNLMERAKNKVNNKVNQKIDQKLDKSIDKGLDGAENATKKGTKAQTGASRDNPGKQPVINRSNKFTSYSKFDFVPGEKLIAAEDFAQDAIGDFPAKWNTNGGGEIVTTNNREGRFLLTKKELVFYPDWIKNLPDNFTAEFDLMSSESFSYYSGFFTIGFSTVANIGSDFKTFGKFKNGRVANGGGFEVGFHPQSAGGQQGQTYFYSSLNNKEFLRNEVEQDQFSEPAKTVVRVSIWRQKTRVRVYMDDKKIWDLPRAMAEGLKLNSVYFRNEGASNENDAFYIGNLRMAVGSPDTRNKLITEGKFVSHGILFDVNSDKIKPESYGAVKDIATVLSENADVKVTIVGHTDSDGDETANMALSGKRAEAVRNALTKDFNIDASRINTDGKGESQPIDNNTSSLGKANNRRVEFIKQ
jgi:OOP family OmpA-OmpF porin